MTNKFFFSRRVGFLFSFLTLAISFISYGCSSGSSGRDSHSAVGGSDAANFNCDGSCAFQQLSAAEVERILQQAVAGAQSLGVNATIAVLDRVGNVLALYQMTGAPATTTVDGRIGAVGGLEGLTVPSVIAVISKAGTGAYLSSQANGFSTRSASQIVQEHFDPGEDQAPGGPLFGVQFSQLICGDVTVLNPSLAGGIPSGNKPKASGLTGPRPLPLGLSADPGGFPLYKQGDLVGGIGVEFDGKYSLDRNIQDFENNQEELVALSGSIGFETPSERTGNNNLVGGKSIRFSDVGFDDVPPLPATLPSLETAGTLVAVPFYTNGTIRDGATFESPASGYTSISRVGVPAAVLVDGAGNVRFPTREGAALPGGEQLQPHEVDAILDSALLTANRTRAAIRRPLDSSARVSIFIVDTSGTPIGFVRGRDAPVFGTDVSIQKARTALFFTSADAGDKLSLVGLGVYAAAMEAFINPTILTGTNAFSARAIGNLARPFYPDGIDGNPNGPLSLPFPTAGGDRTWSPFNDGFQLDVVFQRLAQPLGIPKNPPDSIPDNCADERLGDRLRNGSQIFAGGVPLYRDTTLVGAIGISGDGIDQDDMIGFLGASRKGLDFAGHTDIGGPLGFEAPKEIRSDTIEPVIFGGTRLRYVNCPEGPFVGSNEQNACDGQ